jgi:formamidopyrimidine-DNA glycosylase
MPELPETEVVARALASSCRGACVKKIEILHPEILDRQSDLRTEWYEKSFIQKIRRHGKHIILTLAKEQESACLGIRLGMTGQLLKKDPGALPAPHTHAVICLINRSIELHFRDPRRFGRIFLCRSPLLSWDGSDPLSLRREAFIEILVGRKGRIKPILMNQKLIAGIGNIYANEILFEAGIHPHQQISRLNTSRLEDLYKAMKKVLRGGIQKGGTTIRDFRSLDGTPGRFQEFLRIYGKAGHLCSRAGCSGIIRVVRTSKQAQPSFYCPHCQRKR